MPYEKTIVCLANSRKIGGSCLAGKELIGSTYGSWIRPISNRPDAEISQHEMSYATGDYPQLLDIVAISLLGHTPKGHQRENYLIDNKKRWRRVGAVKWRQLSDMVDDIGGSLWVNGYSSMHGLNDRVPSGHAEKLASSLHLIEPRNLSFLVSTSRIKRQVRASFLFNREKYALVVTDPVIENHFIIDSCISNGTVHNFNSAP